MRRLVKTVWHTTYCDLSPVIPDPSVARRGGLSVRCQSVAGEQRQQKSEKAELGRDAEHIAESQGGQAARHGQQ